MEFKSVRIKLIKFSDGISKTPKKSIKKPKKTRKKSLKTPQKSKKPLKNLKKSPKILKNPKKYVKKSYLILFLFQLKKILSRAEENPRQWPGGCWDYLI